MRTNREGIIARLIAAFRRRPAERAIRCADPELDRLNPKEMTPAERDGVIDRACSAYMRGEMALDEWHRVRDKFGVDWLAAAAALAERRAERRHGGHG